MSDNQNSNLIIGISCILGFNLLSGVQGVYLSGLLQDANVFATLAITFSLVGLFFLVIVRVGNGSFSFVKKDLRVGDIIGINVSTAGSWIGFFFALKYIEPAVASALANAIGPLLTLVLTTLIIKSDKITKNEIFASVGTLFFMLMLIKTTLVQSETSVESWHYLLIGVVMALVCGLSMVMNTIYSKRLNNQGVKSHEIMVFRFVLIITISALVAGKQTLMTTVQDYGYIFLVIAFFGNIIPLYLLQLGISKTPPLIVSNCLVIAPIFFFISQQFTDRFEFSWDVFLYICSSVACVVFGVISKFLAVKKESIRQLS